MFAIVGIVGLDDYGIASDDPLERGTARQTLDYALGASEKPPNWHNRYYGVAFSLPLLLTERPLGLQDKRSIYLLHHLATHLFFIAGGFACGMLAYRMLGSRWIALFAMLTFLLHPRLYAHSFFNVKDVPFAAMLLIALYLAHRAFRKDTAGAFLLCGIGVGLAINLRVFALMLPPMLLAMRALDLRQASDAAERKHILATAGIFAAAALATVYIIHPYYWENPLRFVEGVRVLSQHPTVYIENLFMGEIYHADAVPWNFIPVWFAITSPPVALSLGAIGCAAVCWRAITRPLAALRDRETRFHILLLGCVVLPVAVAIILQSNINQGWRQMYFLWAPFCLIAAVGLNHIANICMGVGIWKVGSRLPGWVDGGRRLHMAQRALAYGVAGAGLITTLTAMAALHPHEYVYFNPLADTKTPGALGERYDLDYWRMAYLEAYRQLLARYPNDTLRVYPATFTARILPQNDRNRIVFAPQNEADFYVHARVNRQRLPLPALHGIQAYGSHIAYTFAPNSDAYRNAHRAAYNDVEANGTLLARSDFDIYAHNGALHYLNANCAPLRANDNVVPFLNIFPANPADLPANSRERGFEMQSHPKTHPAFSNGKCIYKQSLPSYPIARITTWAYNRGELMWRADINLAARAAAQAAYDAIAAGDYGKPVAQSRFDLYLSGNRLAYLKEPCAPADVAARFFLHIFPADPADLPAASREFGFANLDFQFADRGADIDGICVAEIDLPNYPIERFKTGQNAAQSDGNQWRADIDLAALAAAQPVYDAIAAGDYGAPVAQADFDVYLRGNRLAYLKAPCAPADARARFFLHIFPADPADLPAASRAAGFANLDFRFADHGAYASDKCVATRDLPAYPIARIRTGQIAAASGGNQWRADIDLVAHAAAQATAQALYDSIAAGHYGPPVAQSRFDFYRRGNVLAYLKEPCAPGDTHARFLLHITPADPADLPAASRAAGFANLDFRFADRGAHIGDICVATLDLPDYPINRIRAGQFVSGEGRLWHVEFPAAQ